MIASKSKGSIIFLGFILFFSLLAWLIYYFIYENNEKVLRIIEGLRFILYRQMLVLNH
ncbi:MAG: hypothetical protein ACLROI_14510 [Beduini sp.]|uniref:hypothetical protein n=1 Tax=Beduini sp. TaxID=1922300 RepID=UPI0039909401